MPDYFEKLIQVSSMRADMIQIYFELGKVEIQSSTAWTTYFVLLSSEHIEYLLHLYHSKALKYI